MEKENKKHTDSTVHGAKGGPKKGVASGKSRWWKGGVDDLVLVGNNDPNDPNYCSDEEEDITLSATEVISPIESILKEYYASGDVEEAAKTLQENTTISHATFVRKALITAMEKQAYERELTSRLLSSLYLKTLSPEKLEEGFHNVLDGLEDLILDVPDAADLLGKFMARAVLDDILPPAFLEHALEEPGLVGGPGTSAEGVSDRMVVREGLLLALALAKERHRADRLSHVWGPGDHRSVRRLKEETRLLLEEYLEGGDLQGADVGLRHLNAPSFHFQVVKEALQMILLQQRGTVEGDRKRAHLLRLLAFFAGSGLISPEQMSRGFTCLSERLDDLVLDIPNARVQFEMLVMEAQQASWLLKSFSFPVPKPKIEEDSRSDAFQNATTKPATTTTSSSSSSSSASDERKEESM